MKFDFYEDPGHGWAKVPLKLIEKLNLEKDISPFSYIRGDYVYLEEDGDLSKFVVSMKLKGKTTEFRMHHTNRSSKIRNYDSYYPKDD